MELAAHPVSGWWARIRGRKQKPVTGLYLWGGVGRGVGADGGGVGCGVGADGRGGVGRGAYHASIIQGAIRIARKQAYIFFLLSNIPAIVEVMMQNHRSTSGYGR